MDGMEVRMQALVARERRETAPPKTQGFLGEANPPRVSRELRRGREAQPMHDGQTFPCRRGRATTDGTTGKDTRAGFWTSP